MNRLVLFALASVLGLAACNPYLQQQSVAPPGRSARLDEVNGFWGLKRYRIEISEGVAVALTCAKGGPCEHMKVVSDNPAIAEVRAASLAALEQTGYGGPGSRSQPSAAFVLVGKAAGKTRVRISASEGHRDLVVTVVPPPTPIAAAVAAP